MDTIGRAATRPIAYHNISHSDAMPVAACKAGTPRRSYVTVRYRLRGKKAIYRYLNELAGANRYLWNAALAHIKEEFKEAGKSNTSYVSL